MFERRFKFKSVKKYLQRPYGFEINVEEHWHIIPLKEIKMTAQEIESNLTHIAFTSLTNIETWCKELAAEVQAEWPTIVQLVTSGELGRKIIDALALIKPIIGFAEMTFPQMKPVIDWIINILTQIANLYPIAKDCSCPACA